MKMQQFMSKFVSKFHYGLFERTYHNQAMDIKDAKAAAIDSDAMRGWHFDSIEAVE